MTLAVKRAAVLVPSGLPQHGDEEAVLLAHCCSGCGIRRIEQAF
jgi:hypothetical protein